MNYITKIKGHARSQTLYYNTKTKLDLTKLFLQEVSQLQVQIYGKFLKKQKNKVKNTCFTFKNTENNVSLFFLIAKRC